MELRLELALSTSQGEGPGRNQDCHQRKKRSFGNAFLGVEKNVDATRTLPLLIRDESEEQQQQINENIGKVKDNFVVGWPPVKSWRKQLCHHNRRQCATNYVNVENSGGARGGGRRSNYMYVKVKMEGVGIARKVDLSIHRSYHTLASILAALFGKCQETIEEYRLTYQDKEGDWLHARDVPWENFIRSVQRLKLEKNGY